MKMIPCRKCTCGKYNSLAVDVCSCGNNLQYCDTTLEDKDKLQTETPEACGNLDEVEFYVLTCPRCNNKYYTLDANFSVHRCSVCNKTNIAAQKAQKYEEEKKPEESEKKSSQTEEATPAKTVFEGGEDTENWLAKKTETIQAAIGDGEKDETVPDWSAFGIVDGDFADKDETGDNTEPKPETKPSISFTSVHPKGFSFTVSIGEGEQYILGRESNQSEIFAHDRRVGRKHCYLTYENGLWYVTDIHPNGTFLNSDYIGKGNKVPIKDGDVIILGHEFDSPKIQVSSK